MTTPSSKTKILFKKIMVAPLIAGFIFAFAQRVEAQQKNKKPQVVEVKINERGISKKEMNEYKKLFNAGKKHNMYKQKSVQRMIKLYKAMSKKQQKSITDIRKVLPTPPKPHVVEVKLKNPPKIDLVYTYKRLAKRIQKTSKNRKANIIYLNKLYKKMNAAQKKRVVKPSKIPVRIEVIETKKKAKKSSKPKVREVKPVSIKVIEKVNKNELVEVIEEEKEAVEQHELREVEEMPEVVELAEDYASSNQWVEVVEILQSAPGKIDGKSIPPPPSLKVGATKEETKRYKKAYAFWKKNNQKTSKFKRIETLLKYISKLNKRDAKFIYNNKSISFKKAKILISKKNIHNIYANEKNDKTIDVMLSDAPFIRETIKKKN